MTRWLNSLQPFGAFFLRLVLGTTMVYHGYDKVIPAGGFHAHALSALQHHSHYVASLGMPYWLGYVSALTEFVGGIFLILGFLTRFASFMVAVNMFFAILLVNRHHGYGGSEYALALFVMAMMLTFCGAGAFALDRRLGLA
jgi:putative oxidoreductase